jgi:hypothetical protein
MYINIVTKLNPYLTSSVLAITNKIFVPKEEVEIVLLTDDTNMLVVKNILKHKI